MFKVLNDDQRIQFALTDDKLEFTYPSCILYNQLYDIYVKDDEYMAELKDQELRMFTHFILLSEGVL